MESFLPKSVTHLIRCALQKQYWKVTKSGVAVYSTYGDKWKKVLAKDRGVSGTTTKFAYDLDGNSNFSIFPFAEGKWRKAKKPPYRYLSSDYTDIRTFNDELYLIDRAPALTFIVMKYSLELNKWLDVVTIPKADESHQFHESFVLNDTKDLIIFEIPDSKNTPVETIHVYNLSTQETKTWNVKIGVVNVMDWVVFKDEVWFFEHEEGEDRFLKASVVSLKDGTSRETVTPWKRHGRAIASSRYLYVFGMTENRYEENTSIPLCYKYTNQSYRYDESTGEWLPICDRPIDEWPVAVDDDIYIFASNDKSLQLWKYSDKSNVWVEKRSLVH